MFVWFIQTYSPNINICNINSEGIWVLQSKLQFWLINCNLVIMKAWQAITITFDTLSESGCCNCNCNFRELITENFRCWLYYVLLLRYFENDICTVIWDLKAKWCCPCWHLSGVAKRVVFQKGGFGGCSSGTKTGTRVHSDVPPERKPERGYVRVFPWNEKPEWEHVRQNHPFTKPPLWAFVSSRIWEQFM